MKLKLLLALSILASQAVAQTKLIAYKSHSGSAKNFKAFMHKKLFDYHCSNFGGGPEEYVTTAILDSVIFISNTKSVMITSQYCNKFYDGGSKKWKPGRDTVYSHPLFTKQHSLDSIKTVLRDYYYFKNPIDEVSFIGFDNGEKKPEVKKEKVVKEPVEKPVPEKKNYKTGKKTYKPLQFGKGMKKMGLRIKKILKRKKCKSCPGF